MNTRNTMQRQAIFEILKGTKLHPTVEWIYNCLKRKMPRLSQGTVYRNLNVLCEQGLIKKLPPLYRHPSYAASRAASSHNRFDACTILHYHITCEDCGTMTDLKLPRNVSTVFQIAAAKIDFIVTNHHLDVSGICDKCQKKRAGKERGKKKDETDF